MKVLMIHYRYFVEGGPERYLFNMKKLLESKGHIVIPFSIDYPNNEKTEYSKYFPKPIISEFHLSLSKTSFIQKIKIAKKFIYNKDAKKKLKKLISETKPDIAYVLIYSGKLTYSVLEACKEMNLPIVHRISEFYHYCVKSSFFRDNKVCTECLISPFSCVKHSCVHNSKAKSLLNYYAEQKEKHSGIRKNISAIICPSSFTKSIYEKNCIYPNAQFYHVPTFFNFSTLPILNDNLLKERKNNMNVCYIGRICQEKGIDALIDAWRFVEANNSNAKLHLTGFFEDEYCKHIKEKINNYNLNNIICYDFLPKDKTFEIINNSCLSLTPSIWYDNMPNSFIESQAYGLPVIATDIGSLTELVQDGVNGYLFEKNNPDELFKKIIMVLNMPNDEYIEMAKNSFKFISEYCSSENHYEKVIDIFKNTIDRRKN